ncbi:MAG TPA: IPT/TIG domain-containing protein [Acidimicrobiales bacterium]
MRLSKRRAVPRTYDAMRKALLTAGLSSNIASAVWGSVSNITGDPTCTFTQAGTTTPQVGIKILTPYVASEGDIAVGIQVGTDLFLIAGGAGPGGGGGGAILPLVVQVTPEYGPLAAGATVTISGVGFTGVRSVMFGDTACTTYEVVNAGEIIAAAPVGTAGTVDITVVTVMGTSPTIVADQFTYTATPTITAVSPPSGLTTGGTSVVINGTGLLSTALVLFDATPAAGFDVISDTMVIAASPPGSAGAINVSVITAFGTSPSLAPFTYVAASSGSSNPITTLPGMYLNPPVSGSPFYPNHSLSRWRAFTKKQLRQICFVGDSITEGDIGYPTYGLYNNWVDQACAALGVVQGAGFRGLWEKAAQEWTFGGTWTNVYGSGFTGRIATSSAADVAPFGEGYEATGATNTLTWVNPHGYTVQSIDIVAIDVASSGSVPWSYSLNGGTTWTNGPTPLGTNMIYKVSIPAASQLIIRCANASGSAATGAFVGATIYSEQNGLTPSPAQLYQDVSTIGHNIGRTAGALSITDTTFNLPSFFRAASSSASGKKGFDILDLIEPDLIVMMFYNDSTLSNYDASLWIAALDALVTHCGTYADFLLMNVYEGSGSSAQQATFRSDLKSVAAAYGVAVFDLYDYYAAQGYTGNAQTAPFLNPDLIHPNQIGHNTIGAAVAAALGGPISSGSGNGLANTEWLSATAG